MKKIAAIVVLFLSLACDDENVSEQDCDSRLWQLSMFCDTTQNPQVCVYVATFGETEATSGNAQVSEATYNFYVEKGNTNDGSICWEGTQD